MTIIKKNLLLIVTVIAFSCKTSDYNLKDIFISDNLGRLLVQMVDHLDSIGDKSKSIWVKFENDSNSSYLTIIANFNNYDSKAMDGYFRYKDRFISVYGLKNKLNNKFIDLDKLFHGKIDILWDYDYEALNNTNSLKPPPPPPPPGEPYFKKYLILGKNSFKLVQQW